jgi:hypothetical protein
MVNQLESKGPTRAFWIISVIALLWNAIGIVSYWMTVTVSPQALQAMTAPERALYQGMPIWVTSAFAIAVFGGTLASIVLLLRRAWAVPVFVLSLVAILVQMGHAFFMTTMLEVHGLAGAILPTLVIVVGIYLVAFSRSARKKGWIR